jgi:phage shock protein A
MATNKDVAQAITLLNKRVTALEAANSSQQAINDKLAEAITMALEEYVKLRDDTLNTLKVQHEAIEALKAERVIVNADGTIDADMTALQAVDVMSQKLEEISTQVRSLDQAVISLDHFRTTHLRDHEFEASKRQEFVSYFDRGSEE